MTSSERPDERAVRASTPADEQTLVANVGEVMLTKLAENRGKLHWDECSPTFLIARLREEVEELWEAAQGHEETGSHDGEDVWREAADVANFAAMLADSLWPLASAPATQPAPSGEGLRLLGEVVRWWHTEGTTALDLEPLIEKIQAHLREAVPADVPWAGALAATPPPPALDVEKVRALFREMWHESEHPGDGIAEACIVCIRKADDLIAYARLSTEGADPE